MSWWWLLVVAELAWVLVLLVVVVLERRSPAATIAWMLALAFLPLVGILFYRMIGPRRLERKRLRMRVGKRVVADALGAFEDIRAESSEQHRTQLALVPMSLGESPPLHARNLQIFTEGDDAFRSIAEAIAAATDHIHIEYYIWEPDRVGTRLRDQLIAKAKSGVEVRVIFDGIGGYNLGKAWLRAMTDAGIQVEPFNPLRFSKVRRRADFRTHRKIVICDGKVGFTGGVNVSEDHSVEFSGAAGWRDTHLRFDGTAVSALQRVFFEDWHFVSDQPLAMAPRYFPPPEGDHTTVQVVSSGPDSDRYAVQRLFFAAINQASRRVWITTPYFVPDEAIMGAMLGAAYRQVDVRVIVPRKSDSRLIDLAARSYYPELINAGAKLYTYEPRFIHAKTMIVDDDLAMIGTANFDNRSFRLNFEVLAAIYEKDITEQLAKIFEKDLESCTPMNTAQLEKVNILRRFGVAGARLLSPLL